MLAETLNQKEILVNEWTAYRPLTTDDRGVLNEALNGFVGVIYIAEAVSIQMTAGTNYRFKCIASILPALVVWESIVEVYHPLEGKAHITSITKL